MNINHSNNNNNENNNNINKFRGYPDEYLDYGLISPSRYTGGISTSLSPSSQHSYERGIMNKKVPKIIKDVIHGHMEIPIEIQDFIDSVQFQRLRDLKQVGTTSFVFPCAAHHSVDKGDEFLTNSDIYITSNNTIRFEHSLGVSHLAGKFIDRIKNTQPELEITHDEQIAVRIAGLCHDLGHGPFSHAFESWVRTTGKQFHHEEMSVKMLNFLIEDKGLDQYDTSDIKFIENLISGDSTSKPDRKFIFDIVANQRNSIDVDKFDYLARDSYYLGRANNVDFTRLIEFSKVIENEICFCSKEVYNLYELFHARYSLHKIAYTHKVGKAIEYMISDAFSLADPYLKISDQLEDPREIETSKERELEESRKIIKNIRMRNLYKFVDEVILPSEQHAHTIKMSSELIAKEGTDIDVSDVIVENLNLNYAFKDQDPVQHTKFYTRYDNTRKFQIPKEHISHLIPSQFQEKRIRIFCRNKEKYEKIQDAFRKVLKNYNIQPNPSNTVSPMKIPQ
ncbi:HD phosphohydrolase domain-containing protein [Heterostelium album PN500]|uniref:HD phosphohydrolase domain-containing protein n=1 Tax=Heterostelium pallidum (strain ATCC 26659 / Pp 5 / PN500) TaxID=670386 RepID=D3BVI7_HETP5|nr:HD phosphohydrolase domain-containing protein [Heterostelium album PN500]EFA74610.1 HD phosphohydrolase domain-containing protein [Heterostelium album PN500]|eukprot:XP_020426744.1 HD phosphohydrolase domain-containing protein [Heterostelium album PN500]